MPMPGFTAQNSLSTMGALEGGTSYIHLPRQRVHTVEPASLAGRFVHPRMYMR